MLIMGNLFTLGKGLRRRPGCLPGGLAVSALLLAAGLIQSAEADLDAALARVRTAVRAAADQGTPISADLRRQVAELAGRALESVDENSLSWVATAVEGAPNPANPWCLQARPSADGDKAALFLSTVPPGGKQLTGVLRSKVFPLPARLTFYLAGYDGPPDQPRPRKNAVRLRAADTESVLEEALPPAADLAQRVSWDLGYFKGRPCFLEISDGDSANVFSWIAAGRFDPPVVHVPALPPGQVSGRLRAVAELARTLGLKEHGPRFTALLERPGLPADTAAAVATTLASFGPEPRLVALAPLVGDRAAPARLRSNVLQAVLGKTRPDFAAVTHETIRSVPYRLQTVLAEGLAGSQPGQELLLKLVTDGRAPGSLLSEPAVKARLLKAGGADLAPPVEALVASARPFNEDQQRVILLRRANLDFAKARTFRGDLVFTQNCRACHQIGGLGNSVGPALDGIGNRSVERLLEDIFDPNRNLDRAYRTTVLVLGDENEVSGLLQREDDRSVVVANSTGKAVTVSKAKVENRYESAVSTMPENFGDLVLGEELSHLLAFLTQETSGPAAQPLPR